MPTEVYEEGQYTFYFTISPAGYIESVRVALGRSCRGRLMFQLTPLAGQKAKPTWPMTKSEMLDIMMDIGMKSSRSADPEKYLKRDEYAARKQLESLGYPQHWIDRLPLRELISLYDFSLMTKDQLGDRILEFVRGDSDSE